VIGETLKITLDEMMTKNLVSRSEYDRIFEKFDQMMMKNLESFKGNAKTSIKAKIDTYNNAESIWTFHLKNASVSTEKETLTCERLKIVAIDKIEPDEKKGKGNVKGKKKEKKPKKKS